jgi:hypothetical protein
LAGRLVTIKIRVVSSQLVQPETRKISILIATVLLVYALARFITIPETDFAMQLFGVYISLHLNIRTLISLIVIGLTASGSYWMLSDHPHTRRQKIYNHLFLPALSVWVIGYPIIQLPFSPLWLLSYLVGGFVFALVLYAEFITIDQEDARRPVAVVLLTVVSFTIYLTMIIVLYNQATRLLILLPAIFLGSILVSYRTIQLHTHFPRPILESGTIAIISCQISAALHYWPFSSLAFGLAILAPTYSVTLLVINKIQDEQSPNIYIEPSLSLIILWILAYWFR